MKKSLFTALILTMLVSLGSAFAQTDSHDVVIKIPDLLFVRIVDGSTTSAVNFDFQTDTATYINAVNAGGASWLSPTSVIDFSDLQVMSNWAAWKLSVSATSFSDSGGYSDNTGTSPGFTNNGIGLADIRVTPDSSKIDSSKVTSGGVFTLATTAAVATGTNTYGWESVGISGDTYALQVNGDENPGVYRTKVTYTITGP